MALLKIIKLSTKTWKHNSDVDGDFILTKFYAKQEDNDFLLVETYGAKRRKYKINEIEVYDIGGSAETFADFDALFLRLEVLKYPAFYVDGEFTFNPASYDLSEFQNAEVDKFVKESEVLSNNISTYTPATTPLLGTEKALIHDGTDFKEVAVSEVTGDFIPLSGTTVGNPVTGDIEYPYDNGYKIFIDNNSGIERGIAIADTFGMFENSTDGNTLFDLIDGNLRLTTSVLMSKGILSATDFSTVDPTNKLIYAQRQYVDNALVQVYKNISANTTLDDSYHNAVIWVTATCNITIPSGLRADFTANIRTFTGATATYLTSGTVINTESDGDVQAPKTMANISTYSTNNFIISGGGLS